MGCVRVRVVVRGCVRLGAEGVRVGVWMRVVRVGLRVGSEEVRV